MNSYFFQAYLLKNREDDTKSFESVIGICSTAMTFGGISRPEYDTRVKNYHAIRKALENRLVGARRQIRALMLDRALLQLEDRLLHRCNTTVTETHKKVSDSLNEAQILFFLSCAFNF